MQTDYALRRVWTRYLAKNTKNTSSFLRGIQPQLLQVNAVLSSYLKPPTNQRQSRQMHSVTEDCRRIARQVSLDSVSKFRGGTYCTPWPLNRGNGEDPTLKKTSGRFG
ncbi:hypothetical protein CEXT_579581 [Caerostris extrusa]|uniref:Uncharacterized protein n=1 Tax=Caerostris extrusa TaxID=172846 RepID=A0AAV4V1U9_CAEEX|nr:hypothetical protein CEXT_579581 [Caerostris extrusa]